MSEPTYASVADQECVATYQIKSNVGYTYNKKNVLIGDQDTYPSDDVVGYIKGDEKHVVFNKLLRIDDSTKFAYVLMRRTGTHNGVVKFRFSEVVQSGVDAGEPDVGSVPWSVPYQATITAAPGVWQVITIDLRQWIVDILAAVGITNISKDDVTFDTGIRRTICLGIDKDGTPGNTWEVALIGSQAYQVVRNVLSLAFAFTGCEFWSVSDDASQGSWEMATDTYFLPAAQGGRYAPLSMSPYIVFGDDGVGIRMRRRYTLKYSLHAKSVFHLDLIDTQLNVVAQSVTPEEDIQLDSIGFRGKTIGTDKGVGNWYVYIYKDSTVKPNDGTMIATGSLALNLNPRTAGTVYMPIYVFHFQQTVPLVAGTKYWFVFQTSSTSRVDLSRIKDYNSTEGIVYDYEECGISADLGATWSLTSAKSFEFFLLLDGYSTSEEIIFPDAFPEKVHSWHNIRIVSDGSPTIHIQASNDGGDHFGVSPPDYNDGMYAVYSSTFIKSIQCYQDGNDGMRTKAILPSSADGISALNLSYYSQSIESAVPYTPLLTTKEFTASLHRSIRVSDIRDADLEAGEGWVISQLKNAKYGSGVSLDYQDLLGVADSDDAAEFRRRLKFAASYATIANMQSQGIGNTVMGPMTSVSADGMSKSHGYFNAGSANYRKADGIALTFEEKAAREVNGILQFWFAKGYNEVKEFCARRNEFYEPDYNSTAAEVRRKDQWSPVYRRVPP